MVYVRQCCLTLAYVPLRLNCVAIEGGAHMLRRVLGLGDRRSLASWLNDLTKNAKIAFATTVQFALESCIGRVLSAVLRPNQVPPKFWKKARRLIEVAGLPGAAEKFGHLMVLAWVRNSLHSGGIYSGTRPEHVEINGWHYSFVPGKRVACASWRHLFNALDDNLGIYEQAFLAPKIAAIPTVSMSDPP
jgi:hypothetical protein